MVFQYCYSCNNSKYYMWRRIGYIVIFHHQGIFKILTRELNITIYHILCQKYCFKKCCSSDGFSNCFSCNNSQNHLRYIEWDILRYFIILQEFRMSLSFCRRWYSHNSLSTGMGLPYLVGVFWGQIFEQ